MKFHILVYGKQVASFDTDRDRGICLDVLKDYWGFDTDRDRDICFDVLKDYWGMEEMDRKFSKEDEDEDNE